MSNSFFTWGSALKFFIKELTIKGKSKRKKNVFNQGRFKSIPLH